MPNTCAGGGCSRGKESSFPGAAWHKSHSQMLMPEASLMEGDRWGGFARGVSVIDSFAALATQTADDIGRGRPPATRAETSLPTKARFHKRSQIYALPPSKNRVLRKAICYSTKYLSAGGGTGFKLALCGIYCFGHQAAGFLNIAAG